MNDKTEIMQTSSDTMLIASPVESKPVRVQSYRISLLRLYDGYIEREKVIVDCTVPCQPADIVLKLQAMGKLPEWSINGMEEILKNV